MKEQMKPIIMSTEDVLALLDGRKTMARMPIKPQPTYWDEGERIYDKDSIVGPELYSPICVDKDGEQYPGEEVYGIYSDNGEYGCEAPFQPGDVLWVRETWRMQNYGYDPETGEYEGREYQYRANFTDEENACYGRRGGCAPCKWRPSIFMPREAARIFLKVTDVRVERVQEITAADAVREGVARGWGLNNVECLAGGCYNGDFEKSCALCDVPVEGFRQLWNGINAKRGFSWSNNPFVWVIEFKRTPSGAIGPEQDGTVPNADEGVES